MHKIFVLGALVLWLGLAGAQARSYAIGQAGSDLGSFELRLAPSATGTVSTSSLHLTGLADLTDRLAVNADGTAQSYHLEGTARGSALSMDVTFQNGQASFVIDQGGARQTVQVPLPGPVVVLDNSMLDGWQLVASRLDPKATQPQRFDVLVPQVARTGTVTFTAEGPEAIEVGGSSVTAERFDATLDVAGQKVGLTLWLDDGGTIVEFAQPVVGLRYTLETASSRAAAARQRTEADAARAALEKHLLAQRSCFAEQQVQTQSTGASLAGTLTVPRARPDRGAPALLLIPGSGAVDRNGNAPPLITNGMYRQLAYDLGCAGYAVLRIDKLGIGASTGDGNAVTLATYAQNTTDWVALLRSRPDIDPRRVGLIGHSEGGLVALYATAKGYVDPDAVVLLESPGLPLGQLVVDQLVRQARRNGASQAAIATTEAQARQAMEAIRASTGTRLALTGDLANNPIAAAFAHAAGLLRSEIDVDPAQLAAKVSAPMAIVQGGKDIQVLPANGDALHRAAPAATYLVLPDLEHDLYDTKGPAAADAVPGPGTLLSTTLLDALHAYLAGALLPAP